MIITAPKYELLQWCVIVAGAQEPALANHARRAGGTRAADGGRALASGGRSRIRRPRARDARTQGQPAGHADERRGCEHAGVAGARWANARWPLSRAARAPSAAERRGAGGLCNSAGVLPPLRLRARAGLALGVCGLGITWQTAAEYLLAGSERASRACASCTASVAPASACMWQHACATHTVHAPAPHTRAHW